MASRSEFRFIPQTLGLALVVTAIPFGFALVMVVVDLAKVRAAPHEYLAQTAVFTAPFLFTAALSWRRRRLAARIAANEARLGLFLAPGRLELLRPGEAPIELGAADVVRFEAVKRSTTRGARAMDTVVLVTKAWAVDLSLEAYADTGPAEAWCEVLEAWRTR